MGWVVTVAKYAYYAYTVYTAVQQVRQQRSVASVVAAVATVYVGYKATFSVQAQNVVKQAITAKIRSLTKVIANISAVSKSMSIVKLGLGTKVAAISSNFKELLKVVNLQTALKVHNIGMLVSKDYRNTMRKVYYEISEYSEALELGANYINLLLENSRALVLDVSASVGRPYDLGQLVWMKELSAWSKKAATLGTKYHKNPAQIAEDISKWINKPHLDAKARVTQGIFLSLENTMTAIEKTVNDVVKVRNSVGKLVHDLPKSLRKEIEPQIKKITKEFDSFISTKYKPAMSVVNSVIDVLDGDVKKQKKGLSDIVARLRLPGDYISEIDRLSYSRRIEQKFKIAATIGEVDILAGEQIGKDIVPVEMELKRISDLIDLHPPAPSWDVGEKLTPDRRPITVIDKRYTWFVGDF